MASVSWERYSWLAHGRDGRTMSRARGRVAVKSVEALVDDPEYDGDPENIRDWRVDTRADAEEMWELVSSDDELLDAENEEFGAQYDTYDLGE